MKNFRDWWDSLDDIWQRIMILNLNLLHIEDFKGL